MRTAFERAEKTASQCGSFLLATLFLLPSLHWDKRKCRLNRSPGINNRHTSIHDRSRIATAFAVFVVAACASLHGQSPSKQPLDPALAVLGSGFNSDTTQVNGTTLHYVRGGAGSAVILLPGFPEDWYAYHRVIPLLVKQFTVVAVDLRGLGGSAVTTDGCDAVNMAEDTHPLAEPLHLGHVYVVAHDIGGMVAYAFVRRYPETSRGVMIIDVPLPGVGPWDAVKADPIACHIQFHRTPDLPEQLLAGRETIYFRYFRDRDTFSDADVARYAQAYAAPKRWRAMLEIYRAFPRTRNSMLHNGVRSACLLCWRLEKTRLSRNSCRASPQLCGLMGAQTSRSRWLTTARITF